MQQQSRSKSDLPRITNSQKSAAVTAYFRNNPDSKNSSNRKIAEAVGVTEHLVRRIRKELGIPPLPVGYRRETHNPGLKPKPKRRRKS